ncbi:hypothetical protein XCR1_3100004 [Xenorhabdus cabanillasii JM26]|uniref:Uncharacterized protein n=1 Tax=Xenorhabdus cabanillasii JM26 TaxID=1427517 RepID=W1J6I5_9GAMM|nr:hypothetical protein XCR1_3100004 [Xenorhabdus cabanillasii JM26]
MCTGPGAHKKGEIISPLAILEFDDVSNLLIFWSTADNSTLSADNHYIFHAKTLILIIVKIE